MLKNWHHSFRCPEASGNGSPLILRITCGAGDGGGGDGGQRTRARSTGTAVLDSLMLAIPLNDVHRSQGSGWG